MSRHRSSGLGHVLPRFAIILSLFLAACGENAHDRRLDEVDLSDMAVVQQLAQELSAADRAAFTTFAAIHGRAEAGNCGLTLGGKKPETIGQAIQMMRIRLAQFERDHGQAKQPPTAAPGADTQLAEYRAPSLAEVTEMTKAAGR